MQNNLIDGKVYIPFEVWNGGMTYENYFQLLQKLMEQGKTTGTSQTEERLEHAKLNIVRMNRLYQNTILDETAMEKLQHAANDIRFLLIVEGWCGDAAQITPVIEKMIQKRRWQSRYILRDEHPEIMDLFLTNGARSIPAVVALGPTGEVLAGHWGPRPSLLSELVSGWKEQMEKDEWHKLMHTWYAKDKTATLQNDFASWVQKIPAYVESIENK